ncbi:MAG: ATP-binding cassette, subfamily bacterial, partial [Solirubrobacteraceae bacterium]|nr:ATP-binding cassette, subfamily bacterial [Solirubrobacteraceae bacterium]
MAVTDQPAGRPRELLRSLPIMGLLSESQRELVVESFELRSFELGDYLVVEGEASDAFFVLTEGLCRAIGRAADGREVSLNVLRPGDSFGERGLLEDRPRTRSVRASSPVVAARLDGSLFRSLTRLHPEVHEAFSQQARALRLQAFMRMQSTFSVLGPEAVTRMLRDAVERPVIAGERVVSEGSAATSWWVVEDGRLTVFSDSPARRDLRFLRTGDAFGELALLQGVPRTASVEATSDGRLLEFPRSTLDALLAFPEFRGRVDERLAVYERGPARRPVDVAPAADEQPASATASDASPLTGGRSVADGVRLDEQPFDDAPWASPRRRFTLVRQIDEADCGAACVAMLCRAFGHRVSLGHIRHALGTGEQGTTLRGIQRGGEQIGLSVRAIKSSPSRIATLALPVILHWEGNHWVVAYRVERDRVRIADPAGRLRRVPMAELAEKWSGYAATARPTEALADAPRERLDIGWLAPLLRPQRKRLVIAVLLALLATAGGMIPPVLSQRVIDAVIDGRGAGRVHVLVAIMLAVLLASMAASLTQRRVLARVAVELDGDALDFITGQLLGLPMSYFESRRTGDIERRLNGLRQLRAMMVQGFPGVLAGIAQLIVTVVIMFFYSWVVGLAFLATAPIYALLMRWSAVLLKPTF